MNKEKADKNFKAFISLITVLVLVTIVFAALV
jgi:hypothetical protein